jgi:HK97 family phage major capsid protein
MGTADTQRLAEEIVRQATATNGESRSSYSEFRSRAGMRVSLADSTEYTFWKYMTAQPVVFGRSADEADWAPSRYLIEPGEQRTLSRATGPAGGFLVPQDFDSQVTSARRARNVIGNVSRVLVTDHGRALPLPSASAHGVGTWTAESAAYTPSDDTFAQVTVNAHKATTKTILSEELVADALEDFDSYLAGELGERLALLEESAFAVGDGSGKPHGITHSTNGVPTVTAATGSATTFTLADFRTAFAALPAGYQANASWIMSTSAFLNAAASTDSAGAPRLPSLLGSEPALFGRPVYVSPELPAAAASARSVVVGDLSVGYAVRRVRGYGVQRQSEVHSDSGQVGYRIFERVDGRVVLADAMRVLVHSAT